MLDSKLTAGQLTPQDSVHPIKRFLLPEPKLLCFTSTPRIILI